MSSSPDTTSLAAARDVVRAAAKWYVAGLGAIGAVLIAGSQLSSVGALPLTSARLWVAVLGVVIGLAAILWALSLVVDFLAGRLWSFEDVLAAENAAAASVAGSTKAFSARKHPVARWFQDHTSALGGYPNLAAIQEEFDKADADTRGVKSLTTLMTTITDKAATVWVDAWFLRLRWQVGLAVTVAATALLAFAWAANPAPTKDQPAPALRSADLQGADLQGASLRNADLRDARLSGANLRGADLRGANIEGTVWGNTICPDGSNSDVIGTKVSGIKSGTCEGHLIP